MVTVQLSDLRFYAFHGVYEGEAIIGNYYEVDVAVSYHETDEHFENLRDVLNYEELYSDRSEENEYSYPFAGRSSRGHYQYYPATVFLT